MEYRVVRTMNEDELYHYGVVGMKWGVRRARKNYEKANAANQRAAKLEQKGKTKAASQYRDEAARYNAKAKSIQKKHEQRVGGKKAYDYNAKQSAGKTVAKSMLMGTYGALKYNEARSKGATRGRAALEGILYGSGNVATGGVLGVVEPRTREDKWKERGKKASEKARNTSRKAAAKARDIYNG